MVKIVSYFNVYYSDVFFASIAILFKFKYIVEIFSQFFLKRKLSIMIIIRSWFL